jgi:hypothetical protein
MITTFLCSTTTKLETKPPSHHIIIIVALRFHAHEHDINHGLAAQEDANGAISSCTVTKRARSVWIIIARNKRSGMP